ncbi:hypothetical protein [Rubinisphaera brasiliensis]|uniref:IrrE N-terminal-like domain-containing protein n=1 Tax=Rubinisphaera brasiliensis (strain ATCC 49424 / DSM 5305 / JCM 21570 / IAM 15109 / NBRC 103401 / IFAM 1448) TaxID=756272 RepID=F0SKU1_RUBBR|nr:hypothetical protein [Rubinisphaera brasiliensis]ADY58761.1 hypothetical protein Plabr_1145 [Rubinisphaera brasiliensis DSM 5305]
MNEGRYIRSAFIEDVTAQRIREYESKLGVTVTLPVPLEQIVEQVLGLNFDWDEIEEHPGERILGGLDAINKKVLLNEKHLGLFEEKPGLLRSTIGHEAGHFDIDIDRAKLLHPKLPGIDFAPAIAKRHAKKSERLIEVLLDRAATDPDAAELLRGITQAQDTPEQKSAVDRYQSALLMPEWLIHEAAANLDLTSWSVLYGLAERSQVTISNLTVRLQRLGLIYLRDGDRTIYRSEDGWSGQKSLF